MHWIIQHPIKVIISLIIAGLVTVILYTGKIALRLPDLERTVQKHADKLATISANQIILRNELDKPLDSKEIKQLISSVNDIGNAKAHLIDGVQVTGFKTGPAFVSWLPRDQVEKYKATFEPGTFEPADDELQTKKVATYLSAATLTLRPTKWSVDGHNLVGSQESGTLVFSAANDVTSEDLKAWAVNLNDLSSATAKATLDATDEDLNENQ